MLSLKPAHTISRDDARRELYFAISGFWECAEMDAFLYDLGNAAKPFMKKHIAFGAIGNLADFVPQNRETADAIRRSLLLGSKNGLSRFAIVSPPPLVKMQYKRIVQGLEVAFFDDELSARRWLHEAD